jgi:hypothetical protein
LPAFAALRILRDPQPQQEITDVPPFGLIPPDFDRSQEAIPEQQAAQVGAAGVRAVVASHQVPDKLLRWDVHHAVDVDDAGRFERIIRPLERPDASHDQSPDVALFVQCPTIG